MKIYCFYLGNLKKYYICIAIKGISFPIAIGTGNFANPVIHCYEVVKIFWGISSVG